MRNSAKLLIQEPPLQVLPSLAKAIGLNEAIFIQQLHYRLLISKHLYDGFLWYYNTAEEWAEEFPFWSVPTIRRVINRLRDLGVVLTSSKYNQLKQDSTLWYAIDYAALDEVTSDQNRVIMPDDQLDHPMLSNRSSLTPIGGDQLDHTNNLRIEVPPKSEKATPGAGGGPSSQPKAHPYILAYQRIWGMVVASEMIGEAIHEWEGRVTLEAWEYALTESMKANKRTWKYLEGILKRVEIEGLAPKEDTSQAPQSNITDFYLKDIL